MNVATKTIFSLALCLGPLLVFGFGTPEHTIADERGLFNGFRTLGGTRVWTDYIIHCDWRIQKHEAHGQYRLLDPRDRRIAIGTLQRCFAELEKRRQRGQIGRMPTHVVIVMHGLSGTRRWMEDLAQHLRDQGGYTVLNFGYASTQGTIQELTVGLESVIRNLEGVEEVSFVGHSMGNILVRHLLYRFQVLGNPPPITFRRWVMISPPNHGANIAGRIGQSRIIQIALGDVVDQFARNKEWPLLEQQLLTPWFEFGIIAGGRGNDRGYLPRVPGDDDGLISLQTHMLDGNSGFLQVGGLHQIMPKYRATKDATLRFLRDGHF